MVGRADDPLERALAFQLAARAGMQAGDRIVSVNGRPAGDFQAFGKLVQVDAAKSPALAITVERAGRPLRLARRAGQDRRGWHT